MELLIRVSARFQKLSVHKVNSHCRTFHYEASEKPNGSFVAEMRESIGLENNVRELVMKHLVADSTKIFRADSVGNISQ